MLVWQVDHEHSEKLKVMRGRRNRCALFLSCRLSNQQEEILRSTLIVACCFCAASIPSVLLVVSWRSVRAARLRSCSVKDAALVGWNHVLDVNEGVFSTVRLEQFEGLLDEITQVLALSLRVIDFVTHVVVVHLEQVHHWENLAIVWYEGLANSIRADDESL